MNVQRPKSKEQKQEHAAPHVPNFPKLEEKVLAHWKEHNIFQKTLEATRNGSRFVFFEGPPTANGKPGIHHVLARAFKDVIPRFKTMQGFFVERKAGWDTHGLPVELSVEKKLGLKSKREIEAYGIAKFNEECRTSVWEYKEDWEKLTERIGFWLDMEHPYITYDKDYIESLWWILKQIWDKGLLYQGHKVVPHCPRCGTALSSHEVAQGYETVEENSVYVKFRLTDEPDMHVLAWTTTPWTLPGNVALAVGANIQYAKVRFTDNKNKIQETYILAVDALERVFTDRFNLGADKIHSGAIFSEGGTAYDERHLEVINVFSGSELVGKSYQPLFDFLDLGKLTGKKAYYITDANFVTTDEGTGVVHTAVMYGEDDYQLGEQIDLPKHHTVNEDGTFTDEVGAFAGMFVKDAKTEKAIIDYLQEHGELLKPEPYEHEYPFCWRCHSPLLYYAKNSWFINISSLRQQLNDNNQQINWVPDNIKEGRFGEWLKDVKDWALSRERYWGTPLPIWECQHTGCHNTVCIGSFAELSEKATSPLDEKFDPHRPSVDDIRIRCPKCNREMQRIKELCDVWFDSGSMPFAQWHYPFENKERVESGSSFPAEYISEAIDQTRGWFYTLLAVSTLLGKGTPYRNVICLGHILDAKGKKMSKHLGNVVDPWEVIDQYGADALRFHFFTMNQPGEPKLFDIKGAADVVRKNFLILWNVVSFWELVSGNERSADEQNMTDDSHVLDQWIWERLHALIANVTHNLETYQITDAGRELSAFIDELSTWYVRRSRERLKGENGAESRALLRHVLLTVSKLLAPFTPFFAENVYSRVGGLQPSVHLESWPTFQHTSGKLIAAMEKVRALVEAGHALREQSNIRVRQPLSQFVITGTSLEPGLAQILQEELNVKEVIAATALPMGREWVRQELSSDSGVALDTTITDELRHKGWVRELIRAVNDVRKQAKLTPQDHVPVFVHTDDATIRGVFSQQAESIAKEVRASQLTFQLPETRTAEKTFVLDGTRVTVAIA